MKKSIFFGCLAAMALASCSSDEPVSNGQTNLKPLDTPMYLSMNVGQNQARTRAEDDNSINKVQFFFFTSDNQPALYDGTTNVYTWTPGDAETVSVIKASYAIPSKVLAIADGDPDDLASGVVTYSQLMNKTMSQKSSYASTLKTSATYATSADGSEIITATPIAESMFKETAEEAEAEPVQIYLEHAFAKIKVPQDVAYNVCDKDGNPIHYTNGNDVIINDFCFAVINNNSENSYFKLLTSMPTNLGFEANDYTNHTIKWFGNHVSEPFSWLEGDWSWYASGTQYAAESLPDRNTKLVLTCNLNNDVFSFNGKYYDYASFTELMNSYLASNNCSFALKQSDNWIDSEGPNKYSLNISDPKALALISKLNFSYYPSDERRYYTASIPHLGESGSVGEYGVVRNFIYNIKLNKIFGFGTEISIGEPYNPNVEPENPSIKQSLGISLTVNPWMETNPSFDMM